MAHVIHSLLKYFSQRNFTTISDKEVRKRIIEWTNNFDLEEEE